jgi:hypothetical protein
MAGHQTLDHEVSDSFFFAARYKGLKTSSLLWQKAEENTDEVAVNINS